MMFEPFLLPSNVLTRGVIGQGLESLSKVVLSKNMCVWGLHQQVLLINTDGLGLLMGVIQLTAQPYYTENIIMEKFDFYLTPAMLALKQ